MGVPRTVRILHLEDNEMDRELAAAALGGAGLNCEITAVCGRADYETAVRTRQFDLILSDFNMPDFDGASACAMSQEISPGTPFVFLSGTVGEERAINLLRQGATDYVLKDRMARLGSAVQRALEDAQVRAAHDRAHEELRQLNAELEARIEERTAELAAAREEADRANRAKSEFLSRMSHELRTPMNAVIGFAQLLEMEVTSPEQRESVRHILSGGRHLLSLINEVLDISRIETGHLSLSLEPVQLGEVLGHAVELMSPLAAQRSIAVVQEPMPTGMHVIADRQRLGQIVLNLLSNAVKYNRPNGRITIAARCANGCGRLSVTDTGAGIPAGKLSLLFQPFQCLGAEATAIEGTGLGLMLSSALAQLMGGRIGVDSVVDQGSTFWVELPLAENPQATASLAAEAGIATDVAPGSGTVLYIEDNLANVRLMERLMRQRPQVRLVQASHGLEGLQLLRRERAGLVLLDMNLPDVSGDEVLRQIWADPETRRVPVVVLTADASPALARRVQAAGAARCLTKPLDIAVVLRTVDELLGKAAIDQDAAGSEK